MTRHRPPQPDRTESDRTLWHAVAEKIKPLKGQHKKSLPLPLHPADIAIPKTTPTAPRPKAALPTLSAAHSTEMDASTLRRLRAGDMPIAGRLDLHGFYQEEAFAALTRFVHFSYHNGRRCVLVVTGKSGILRQKVPMWLNEEGLRPYILAIAPARKHGGEGALYVLLKRRRS